MEIADKHIQSCLQERIKQDAQLFFVDIVNVSSAHGMDVVRRKKRFGISIEGKVVLPPVFDGVEVLTNRALVLLFEGKYAIYDIMQKQYLTQFDILSYSKEDTYYKLCRDANDFVLYDSERNRLLQGKRGYTEYNLRQKNTEFIWAKRGHFFDYIERCTGTLYSLPGVVMAYDTDKGMFGQDEYGKVFLFNENGVENPDMLRKIVIEAGGYLTLINFTYNVEHIIDVYGNIVNI